MRSGPNATSSLPSTCAAWVGFRISTHQVEPSSAYTLPPGWMPAFRTELISRFTPRSAVVSVYGPSSPADSNPEWYTTNRSSGCARAAGPTSTGDAYGLPPEKPLCTHTMSGPVSSTLARNDSPTRGAAASWSSSHQPGPGAWV